MFKPITPAAVVHLPIASAPTVVQSVAELLKLGASELDERLADCKLWLMATGKELRVPVLHRFWVCSVMLSSDFQLFTIDNEKNCWKLGR